MKALLPSSFWLYDLPISLLDLVTLTILGERYKLLSSSMLNFLHSPFASLLGQNIRLGILLTNILSLHSSLNERDHPSHPYNKLPLVMEPKGPKPNSKGFRQYLYWAKTILRHTDLYFFKNISKASPQLELDLPRGLFPVGLSWCCENISTFSLSGKISFPCQSSRFTHPDYARWIIETTEFLIAKHSPIPILLSWVQILVL